MGGNVNLMCSVNCFCSLNQIHFPQWTTEWTTKKQPIPSLFPLCVYYTSMQFLWAIYCFLHSKVTVDNRLKYPKQPIPQILCGLIIKLHLSLIFFPYPVLHMAVSWSSYMWPDSRKGTFFTHKMLPIFWTLKLHFFLIIAYNGVKFSMHKATAFGYTLTLNVT